MTTTSERASTGLLGGLSLMMFLQYAIWGAWLPLFFVWLTDHRGFSPEDAGNLFAIGAIGALIAPFLAGQIADRWFDSEKFLGLSHIVGAALIWKLPDLETYREVLIFSLLYSLIYAPTLSLTNSVAFHHLPDRDRDFGKVRVWGTVGWIAVGIGMGQWLLHRHTPTDPDAATEVVKAMQVAGMSDAFRLSAIIGAVLGLYCFFLPKTPPQKGKESFAAGEVIKEVLRSRHLRVLFLVAFPVSCVHQFYFVRTAGFLKDLDLDSDFIGRIFGVGGGGLMTIGQISEIAVLALMPVIAVKLSRKSLLSIGLAAYVLRFFVFAMMPTPAAVIPALALHGLCFGCFFFIAFMIVDEETTSDVRASAQSLFSLVIFGFGVIVGNLAAGWVGKIAATSSGGVDYHALFRIPMFVSVACLALLVLFYPRRRTVSS